MVVINLGHFTRNVNFAGNPLGLSNENNSFDNKIVEAYLNDELENKKPKLTKAFND